MTNNFLLPKDEQTFFKFLNKRNDQSRKSNIMSQLGETNITNKNQVKFLEKTKLSFFNYSKSLFCKTAYGKIIHIYNSFRIKLLIEEHLLKSHLYISKIVENNPCFFKEFNFLDIMDLKNNL